MPLTADQWAYLSHAEEPVPLRMLCPRAEPLRRSEAAGIRSPDTRTDVYACPGFAESAGRELGWDLELARVALS